MEEEEEEEEQSFQHHSLASYILHYSKLFMIPIFILISANLDQ